MNPRLVVSGGICALVILFGIFFFATREHVSVQGEIEKDEKTALAPEVRISDSVKKTTHTITGEITVPTPCVTVAAESSVDVSQTPSVIFIKITTNESEGVCLQRPETKTFTLSATAEGDATFRTFVNGSEVPHS